MLNRAYSILEVKSFDEEKRILEGIATTPTPDRMGDVIVSEGMEFQLPFPLLWQHNSSKPIGTVTAAKATKDGISIRAQVAETGIADWIDEAWALIRAKLVRGLSVGFRPLEDPEWDKGLQGYRFGRTELIELSAVTIPANSEATILTVKSACGAPAGDSATRRVVPVRFGIPNPTIPGASGGATNGKNMTIKEQITALENKRAAVVARNAEVIKAAGDAGRAMEAAEGQEVDDNQAQVETIDKDLVRLKAHEKTLISTATPITEKTASTEESASRARGGVITVKGPDLGKGMRFARFAMAIGAGKGDLNRAYNLAKSHKPWQDTSPDVIEVLKAAADAGTTTDATWAGALVQYQDLASEFLDFLRPMTIVGKIPGLTRVPFNVRVGRMTTGTAGGWVGEGAQKPVTQGAFDTVTLKWKKVAALVVLTDELVRFSNPSAEAKVRTDLAAGLSQLIDTQFIDPSASGTTDISPASITSGAANDSASGTSADNFRTDAKAAFAAFDAVNLPAEGFVWVMQSTLARAMGMLLNPLGQPEFPGISAGGGTLLGYPVVTSQSVPSGDIVIFRAPDILVADDGTVTIDTSREATVTMDDGSSPAVTTQVSLWQNNMVGLRAERYIDWVLGRDDSVYYITSANYGGA